MAKLDLVDSNLTNRIKEVVTIEGEIEANVDENLGWVLDDRIFVPYSPGVS